MAAALIDSDTLSEVVKGRDQTVRAHSLTYLAVHGKFTFSIITQYEILRGLMAKQAIRQIQTFKHRCAGSSVLPLTDSIVDKAADIYGQLHRTGQLISDADILIAATALAHGLDVVTENVSHYGRIAGLTLRSWRVP